MAHPIDANVILLLLPELILILLAVCVYVGGAFSGQRSAWITVGLIAFAFAAIALLRQADSAVEAPDGSFFRLTSAGLVFDPLSYLFRWIGLFLGVLLLLNHLPMQRFGLFTEGIGSIVFIATGVMLTALAADLVTLFLGLELISIPTYVLLFLSRHDKRGAESAAKYFFLSLLASAFLLYGFSMLYGLSGTTDLTEMQLVLSAKWNQQGLGVVPVLPLAVSLVFVGLSFKVAAAPLHYYAPDVYQATTNANAGLLAVVPKLAGVIALVRLFGNAISVDSNVAWQLIVVLSLFTMTFGNAAALCQKSLRRMLAYSSIANAGYLLIGLAAGIAMKQHGLSATDGTSAMLVYVVFYSLGALGVLSALAYLDDDVTDYSAIRQIKGLRRRHPLVAAIIAISLFSLSGIPPLAGFWGKFLLFKSAIQATTIPDASVWFWILVVGAAINAAIAAAYYLRVIGVMYFHAADPIEMPRYLPQGAFGPGSVALLCALITLFSSFPGWLVERAYNAAAANSLSRVVDVPLGEADVVSMEIEQDGSTEVQ